MQFLLSRNWKLRSAYTKQDIQDDAHINSKWNALYRL